MTELIEAVTRHGDIDSGEEARTATRAVLVALGKRIARGEAEDIAAHLSGDPADWVVQGDGDGPTSLSVDEFVAYVAEEADTDTDRAWEYVEAVLGGFSDVLTEAEFRGITSQFPPEYDRLLVET
ncbi:MAG: DUF2267 domain-containing protein [Halobacterium sp.]